MKQIERFCKMINLAVRLEWIDRNPFHAYQLKFDKVEREYLTKDELARIEAKKFNIVRLQVVQDLFVFSCYTGLAYIDVFNLTRANLIERSANNIWIATNRQKTNEPIIVPLLPKALAIIEKYKGHPQALAEGKVLPILSNQRSLIIWAIAVAPSYQRNLKVLRAKRTASSKVRKQPGESLSTKFELNINR